jgi:uncharacterized repeat protein (TIGR01451 family)
MRRTSHRADGHRRIVVGSMIVAVLAMGQAGTLIASAASPVDSPEPVSEAVTESLIADTLSSSNGCVALGVDDATSVGGEGEASGEDPGDPGSSGDPTPCQEEVPTERESVPTERELDVTVVDAAGGVEATVDEPTLPDLQVTKSSDADGILHNGDSFLYTITVTNVGDEVATGVEFVDVLPPRALNVGTWMPVAAFAGTCTVTGSSPPGGPSHAELQCGPVSLDAHESESVTLRVFVNGNVCGSITNVVNVEGTNEPAANAGADNHAEASVDIACVPGIQLSKGGPSLAHVGDTITYRFVARNKGKIDLTDIDLSDPKCDSSPTLVEDGNGNATLSVGEAWTFECDRTISPGDGNIVRNQATVTGDHEGGTVRDTDRHDVDVIHPNIDLQKNATPSAGPAGTLIVYTYTVTNTGDTRLFDVAVSDDKVGAVGAIATLAAGATAELTSEITLGSSPITNVGTASGEDRLGRSVEAHDTATVTVVSGGGGGGDGGDGTGGSGGSPFTGSDTGILATWIVALSALGAVLLVASRRRA